MTTTRGRAPRSAAQDGRKPGFRRRWIAWEPGGETLVALVSLLGMWAGYAATAATHSPWPLYAAILTAGTALPAWAVFLRRAGTWADLGVTRRRLVVSLVLSVALGASSLMAALRLAHEHGIDPVAHLAANVVVLWEPLFFFGWLCLAYERAFGALAAPILTGVSFTVMHLGAVPVEQAVAFGAFGLFFAVLATATRNLAVLWPLAYPVTSAIGTLQSGIGFGWDSAAWGAVLLLVQVVLLFAVARRARDGRPAAGR